MAQRREDELSMGTGTRVYVDPDAIMVSLPTDDRRRRPGRRRLAPGASEVLKHLSDAHYEIVMLGSRESNGVPPLGIDVSYAESVESSSDDTWVITADPAWCDRERVPGVLTVLVGPHRPPGPRPTAHCDIEARDIGAAVMEILAHEAMVG